MSGLLIAALAFTVAIGVAVARAFWAERRGGVLVLLYHRLRDDADYAAQVGAERLFSIPAARLREHLAWLRSRGARFLTLDELAAWLAGGEAPPAGSVCLTFDDGAESVHRLALPILRELGLPAAVFVTSDPASWVFGDERRCTAGELRALSAGGVAIGSHGVSHHGLRGMAPDALDRELRDSRAALEAIVSTPVRDLSLPLGFYDRAALEAARAAGYRLVFTARPGRVRAGDDPLTLRRLQVEGLTTLADFQRVITPRVLAERRIVSFVKRLPGRLLGERRWMPLREKLFASPAGRLFAFGRLRALLAWAGAAWVSLLLLLWVLETRY